jgi:hypothetical protein
LKKRKAVEKAKEAREARELVRRKVKIVIMGNKMMTYYLMNEAFKSTVVITLTIFRD